MNFLHIFYSHLLNFLFPKHCIACKKSGTALCASCLSKIDKKTRVLEVKNLKIHYLYNFKNPIIHEALWQSKYHANLEILQILGKILGTEILKNFDSQPTFLIPIPLTNSDRRLHNHAFILAKTTGLKIADILEKNTEHKQARLEHRSEREENIKGKILVSEKKLNKFLQQNNLDKNDLEKYDFLLIDDTVTTGSTLLESQKTLIIHNINVDTAYTIAH